MNMDTPVANEGFLNDGWAQDHAGTVDALPLEPRFGLTYLPEAMSTSRSILDVGCGGGQLRRYVSQLNPTAGYIGADFSGASLQQARGRFKREPLVRADGADLPFGEASVDVVYQHDVLMHHPRPLRMLSEMYRVCRTAIVFNARVSPRLDDVLTLEDRQHAIQYQTLPLDAMLHRLLSASPPPRLLRFKVVEMIGVNRTRFDWTERPHYWQVLGCGRQFHVHAVAYKGEARTVPRVVNDTSVALWSALLAWAGRRKLATYLRGIRRA